MATRMQQRRGTASQWSSSNPTLGAGEIGWESDTNKFKIGDGTNLWNDLDYFVDQASLNTSLGDYVETATLEQANGVATLDSNAKLKTSQLPDVALVTVHAVADQAARLALSVEPGDIAIQTDNGQTYVLSASPASTNGNWTAITVADPFPTKDTDDLAEGATNKYFTDERAQDAVGNSLGSGLSYNDGTGAISVDTSVIQARVVDVSDTEIGYLNGVTSGIQSQLDSKANLSGATFTGDVSLHADPTQALQAATKQYVDNAIEGLNWKSQVNLLSNSDTNITGSTGTLIIDGHDALVQADNGYRILLINQNIDAENGIYIYTDNGSVYTLVRSDDANTFSELLSASVYVLEGTTYGGTAWIQSNYSLSSFAGQNWVQFSGAGTVTAGAGILVDGLQISIDTSTTVDTSTLQTLTNKTISGSSNTITNIGNNSLSNSSITINGSPVSLGGSVTIDALPLQSGNSGKYLTTDGTTASWSAIDLSTYAPLNSPTFTGTVTLPNETVTNDMLAGSISNNKLLNSSITINGASVSLGGTVTISGESFSPFMMMGA